MGYGWLEALIDTQLRPSFFMELELKELIDFAKKTKKFSDFSDENMEAFFRKYANSIIVRQSKAGRVNGFAFTLSKSEREIEVVTVCLTGSKKDNYRDMRAFLRRWKSIGLIVTWTKDDPTDNRFCTLSDCFDRQLLN